MELRSGVQFVSYTGLPLFLEYKNKVFLKNNGMCYIMWDLKPYDDDKEANTSFSVSSVKFESMKQCMWGGKTLLLCKRKNYRPCFGYTIKEDFLYGFYSDDKGSRIKMVQDRLDECIKDGFSSDFITKEFDKYRESINDEIGENMDMVSFYKKFLKKTITMKDNSGCRYLVITRSDLTTIDPFKFCEIKDESLLYTGEGLNCTRIAEINYANWLTSRASNAMVIF
jgi:hypothetical protein